MPLFLYPFLNTNSKDRAFEYLRLTSLGVIGALVKVNLLFPSLTFPFSPHRPTIWLPPLPVGAVAATVLCIACAAMWVFLFAKLRCCGGQTDETEVISFLLQTEIIPLCLRIMETGSELSKTVATFIVQKILLDDSGLQYICQTCVSPGKLSFHLSRKASRHWVAHP